MSFKGDLEHLPIVDVIQLMNSSRKSGILSINGRKGESQLVFKEGYIVSANHLNNSVRIGELLVNSGVITDQQLEQSLRKQKTDGPERKPLVITLIEMGLVKESEAYNGLQQLIEMTIVEVLTWKKGTFTLEPISKSIQCEFSYYPDKMNLEINVNTQSMLMDALRVYDEKMRDGLLPEEPDEVAEKLNELLSEDDLGLSELEQIHPQLPKPFSGLAPFDPLKFQREKLGELSPLLPAASIESLALFLAPKTVNPDQPQPTAALQAARVILFSPDRLLTHAITTVCTFAGVNVVAETTGQRMEELVNEATTSGCRHILFFDCQAADNSLSGADSPVSIRTNVFRQHPEEHILQLANAADFNFILESYLSGVKAVIPRPRTDGEQERFITDLILLLEMLPAYFLINSV